VGPALKQTPFSGGRGVVMKKKCILLVMFVLGAALGFGDTQIQIERLESRVNSGFRERIYIDGRNVLTLANGRSGTVTVSDGPHKIYAELYTLKTDEVLFNAAGGTMQISIAANSMDNFVINIGGVAPIPQVPVPQVSVPGTPAPQRQAARQGSLEAALYTAADVVLARITPRTTIAVVSIASANIEEAEFVVDELAYVIVSSGNFRVVDRKSLDAIRSEQNFQTSGDVDDDSAVSIGKLLGANIVITGSISGAGSTRRLRLKALDVMTAEIVAMASEAF
jgi:hypothetical protein